jgi:hypothetical protein
MTAVSNTAMFPQLPVHLYGVATGANTTLSDSPDNTVELVLPSDIETDGGQLTGLWASPRATIAATVLRLYVSLDNGTTKREALAELAAVDTVSTSDAPVPVYFTYLGAKISAANPFLLMPGASGAKMRLYASASVALSAGWVFHAQIERFTKAAVG